tara:strand:- start:3632 stop:3952 length:321 start_codon:yes stop_codon:yes gene_type:complete
MLTKRGYTVLEAENGEIALEIILEGEVDLAIVDIMMPTMGGLELRQAMGEHSHPTPTILITGQPELVASLVEDDSDFQSGPISLLKKPAHPVKLLAETEKRLAQTK